MRKLITLDGSVVPPNVAYTEAAKGLGTIVLVYSVGFLLWNIGRGYMEAVAEEREALARLKK